MNKAKRAAMAAKFKAKTKVAEPEPEVAVEEVVVPTVEEVEAEVAAESPVVEEQETPAASEESEQETPADERMSPAKRKAIDGLNKVVSGTLPCTDPRLVIVGKDRVDEFPPGKYGTLYQPNRNAVTYEQRGQLRESLKLFGFLKGKFIVVRKDGAASDATLLVVRGRNILMAAREVAEETGTVLQVGVMPDKGNDAFMFGSMVVENTTGIPIDSIQIALDIKKGLDMGIPREQLEVMFNKSPSAQRQFEKLLDLSDKLQKEVAKGRLPFAAAVKLAILPTKKQEEEFDRLKREGKLTNAEVEVAVRDARKTDPAERGQRAARPGPGLLRKMVKLVLAKKIIVEGAKTLTFWDGLKFASGDLPPAKIKGMQNAMTRLLPGKKRPGLVKKTKAE